MPRRFPSRIDSWLAGLAFGPLLLGVLALVYASMRDPTMRLSEMTIGIVALLAAGGGLLWMFRTTHYTVDGATLRIRGGPWWMNIAIAEITSVKPSRSLRSSPALSLDRLEIQYGDGKSVRISPADREGFLRALREAGVPEEAIGR